MAQQGGSVPHALSRRRKPAGGARRSVPCSARMVRAGRRVRQGTMHPPLSSRSWAPTAATEWRGLVARTTGAEASQLRRTHASATLAMVTPRRSASVSTASRVRAQRENALIRWTRSGRGDGVCPNPATHVLVCDGELDAAREVVPDDYSRVDLHGVWTEPDPSPTRLGLRVTSNWQCVLAEFLIGECLQSVVGGDTLQDAVVHHAVDTGAVSLVGSHARTSLHQATKIRLERIEHMFYY